MDAMEMVARLMEVSAVTAPKSLGENFVHTRILSAGEVDKLAEAMAAFGRKTGKQNFDRDAKSLLGAGVLLIGIKDARPVGLRCGACGFSSCDELARQKKIQGEFSGPVCAFRLLDMGIALGSAVKTASLLNVDNRIMYRIGVVARDMGLVDWDFTMGIPLSVTGKNVFFDR
ncbi:MAG: hypothetical protein JRI97_08505 [Deltaproteobacteria bacterium]|nr:hypothetical protein [Deltaproteobacteria bacterium]